jgi:hypothetical protein
MSCQLNDQLLSSIRSTGCATNSFTRRSYLLCRARSRFTVTRLHPDSTKLHAQKKYLSRYSYGPTPIAEELTSVASPVPVVAGDPIPGLNSMAIDRQEAAATTASFPRTSERNIERKDAYKSSPAVRRGRATAGAAWRQSELAEFSERSGPQLSRAAGRPRASEGNRGGRERCLDGRPGAGERSRVSGAGTQQGGGESWTESGCGGGDDSPCV